VQSKCALHVVSGLDILSGAWESKGMVAHRSGGSHGTLGVGLALVLLSLAASVGAGLGCHVPQPSVGTGGQSGDEGSRPTTPWLGAGGAAPDLGARR
jgi:hypothetical protein